MVVSFLYCDGGIVNSNPSKKGGTWCWCSVDEKGERLDFKSGVITPLDIEKEVVSNNDSELFAALKALESAPEGWAGTLVTDSMVTKNRLSNSQAFKGCPPWMQKKAREVRANRKWNIEMVAGHPTQKQLEQGWKVKRGTKKPVSAWNVFCDRECCRLAEWYERFLNEGKQ